MARIYIQLDDDHPSPDVLHIILGPRNGLRRVRIRIERPKHFKDQRSAKQPFHGHVEERRGGDWVEIQVLHPDGSASHRTKSGDAIRAEVADALRRHGWDIHKDNVVRFIPDAFDRLIVASGDLLESDIIVVVIDLFVLPGEIDELT